MVILSTLAWDLLMDSILLFDAQMVLLHIKKCIVVMIVFNEFNEGF